MRLRYLSLFSGIEAATAAWEKLGWDCVGVSEIEPLPCSILAHRLPGIPNLGDITKITEQQIMALGDIDFIVFGSPCQDLSVAGKREGLAGERSGLFSYAIRIIEWARKHCNLRFAMWENVPGAFSSNKGRDFAAVVGALAGLEDVEPPKNGWGKEGAALGVHGMLEWAVLDAQWFGLAQRRRRVFAFVDFGDWASRPPVLLEPESLRGDTPPSRETRQEAAHDVAPSLISSGRGTERVGETRGQVSQTLNAVLHKGQTMPEKNRSPAVLQSLSVHGTQDPDIAENFAHTLGRNRGQENVVQLPGQIKVRRLTPIECERLQGFKDNWTQVPHNGKPAADGPRYKAIGNSMAVNVMFWIGCKIEAAATA